MPVELCRHIRPNGLQCQAVALKSSVFCYFHRRLHDSHRVYRNTIVARPDLQRQGAIFDLGTLEDRVAIQIAISKVVNALATNQIDLKHARALLYGLQLASANARNLDPVPAPQSVVREVHLSPSLLDETATDIAAPGATTELPDQTTKLPTNEPETTDFTPIASLQTETAGLVLCAAAHPRSVRSRCRRTRPTRRKPASALGAIEFSSGVASNRGGASNGMDADKTASTARVDSANSGVCLRAARAGRAGVGAV